MVKNKELTIFQEYVELSKKYKELYGDKTIVLICVGSFYEAYGIEDPETGIVTGEDVKAMGGLLNIIYSKRNKNNVDISEKNPYMCGFPTSVLDKYTDILISKKYTIIIVDQYENEMGSNGKKDRRVSEIISPSTYMKDIVSYQSNYLMVIYLYQYRNRKGCGKEMITQFAISIVELSIGCISLYDSSDFNSSSGIDEKVLFDHMYRILLKYNPREIVIFGLVDQEKLSFDTIRAYLNLDINNSSVHNQLGTERFNEAVLCVNFQSELLKRIYPNTGMLTPVEYIDLERHPEMITCLCHSMNFIHQHNPRIIEKIKKPEMMRSSNQCMLGNNLICKLNIISESEHGDKYSSLLNILNNSVTAMGKRYLQDCLLNPLVNSKEIKERYRLNKLVLMNGKFKEIRRYLSSIGDLERLFRKIYMYKLKPQEFIIIYNSLVAITHVCEYYIAIESHDANKKLQDDNKTLRTDIFELSKYLYDTLNISHLETCENRYTLENLDGKIFNKGVYQDIDKTQLYVNSLTEFFTVLKNTLNSVNSEYFSKNFFKVDHNDQLGYHLVITKSRYDIFKRRHGDDYKINIDKISIADNDINNMIPCTIKFGNFVIKKISTTNSNIRLVLPEFDNINLHIQILSSSLSEKCQEAYKKFCLELYNKHEILFQKVITFTKTMDYCTTNAYNSIEYHYCCPVVHDSDEDTNLSNTSFVKAQGIRHPIIEIISNTPYVDNDISLGIDDTRGILLYGMNSAGKSSLMKSVGMCIIMAQAGMFVPCSYLEYRPYHKIFSRIPGNDDIFHGKSSFICEIEELRNILRQVDKHSLVIGDELLCSSESISSLSIITTSIMRLMEMRCSFIFSSHLHELINIPQIKVLMDPSQKMTLKVKHLSVKYDNDLDALIFVRKLEEGDGDRLYGLEVCRSLDMGQKFMESCYLIRTEILGTSGFFSSDGCLVKDKKSRYNSAMYLGKCNICEIMDATETHHIVFQSKADENGFVGNYHKNRKFNLMGLCDKCHDELHGGKISIDEVIQTSNGAINIITKTT
jgi:DNA mismatch repair protein MutS